MLRLASSYSPCRARKNKLKTKKRKSAKKTQTLQHTKINEASEEDSSHDRKLLNLRLDTADDDQPITAEQARAAFYIFVVWKLRKHMSSTDGPDADKPCSQRWSKASNLDAQQHSELNSNIEERSPNDCNVIGYSPSDAGGRGKYDTAVRNSKRALDTSHSPKSAAEYNEEGSEITRVLIKSVNTDERDNADDEAKYDVDNTDLYRERRNKTIDDEDDKEAAKMVSIQNPFETTEDNLDIKDKVIHLSTINTDENFGHKDNDFTMSGDADDQVRSANNKQPIDKHNEAQDDEDVNDKIVSLRIDHEELPKIAKSDNKKLFSGSGSLLREIISRTPRSNNDRQSKHRASQNKQGKSSWSKDDNSDAATRKRVDISHLGGIVTPGSSASSQLFQNNTSFQRFSLLQFNSIMESKDFGVLLQLREKAIKYREKQEHKLISKMIESQKYSPRMLNNRKLELEKWVTKEKEEIKKTKNQLIERWNQTKNMLEQTEHFAQVIKQQIGSLDCSRKVSISYPNVQEEQDISSMNLRSYHDEDKTENSETVDEDEETKVIHYSEPHRLVQSESDNVLGLKSGSEISLRISVLSNKSEDLDFSKNKIELYKLQRTREMNRISSLIAADLVEERKNQSETLNIGNVFKKLLDDNDNFRGFHVKKINANVKPANNKIFDYTPADDNQNANWYESQHSSAEICEPDKTPKSDIVNKIATLSNWDNASSQNNANADNQSDLSNLESHHHRRSSSNDNIGIKKADDLDIEKLLEGDDQDELSQNEGDNDYNKLFSGNVNFQIFDELKNIDDCGPEDGSEDKQDNNDLHSDQQLNLDLPKADVDMQHEQSSLDRNPVADQELEAVDWTDETDKLFSKSCNSELKDLLSLKRDLTSKLISSLNSKQTSLSKGNNMLIFEDSNEPSQDNSNVDDNKPSSEESKPEISQNSVSIQSAQDDQAAMKDQIVNELLGMLVGEIKETLVPHRNVISQQPINNSQLLNFGPERQMYPRYHYLKLIYI